MLADASILPGYPPHPFRRHLYWYREGPFEQLRLVEGGPDIVIRPGELERVLGATDGRVGAPR